MSYTGISIREALDKINDPNGGWYLPQVQRQYVWGARHESETYICLLLDSLLKRYPIGGIVLWETNQRIPYRQFIGDYIPGQFARQVEDGRWGAPKSLVYDGQQRLQTLYSVLRHRFNNRILYFDLLFDQDDAEADETGFLFRDTGEEPNLRYLRMTELSCLQCNENQYIALEDQVLCVASDNKNKRVLIRRNLKALWDIFVEINHKSIAFFSVRANTPTEVNEVFRRLNTGGVALTQLELVLGKIKAKYSDYEERLWLVAEKIEKSSEIKFPSTSVLQFFHLLVKDTIRIDEGRLVTADIDTFQNLLQNETNPLVELFSGYLRTILNINHASIIPRWLAILPLATYLTIRQRHGHNWRIRSLSAQHLQLIHQYFLLSQFCDWNTQTMVNAFSQVASIAARDGLEFPLEQIRLIAIEKNRTGYLNEYQLLSQPWLATKILMHKRSYVFHENKPQVDHIFPINLDGGDEAYQHTVDVLWNFQPIPAEVNNYKRARHPREFFQSKDGSKYWNSYDFIPLADPNSWTESEASLWNDYKAFITFRRQKMLDELFRFYGLTIA